MYSEFGKESNESIIEQLVEPLEEMGRKLQHYIMQELRQAIKGLTTALAPIRDAISEFNSMVQKALDELCKLKKVKCYEITSLP